MTFYEDPLVTLLLGDCLAVMAELPDASVDAVVTDPPYGLEFMGKEWDRIGKPGIGDRPTDWVSFSSTTAYAAPNQTCGTCGGRERGAKKCSCDVPAWKPIGNRRGSDAPEGMTGGGYRKHLRAMQEWHEAWAREAFRVVKPGAHLLAFGGTRTVHRMTAALEDAGWEIRDMLVWAYASGFPKSLDVGKALDKAAGAEREVVGQRKNLNRTKQRGEAAAFNSARGGMMREDRDTFADTPIPATDLARQWDGWGTALKPAWEPIVLARKPLVGTVAGNVTRYGTGALNISATRIGTTKDVPHSPARAHQGFEGKSFAMPDRVAEGDGWNPHVGRWPSNLLLSDPELFDEPNPWVVGSGATATSGARHGEYDGSGSWSGPYGGVDRSLEGDTGGYSRFFLVPKSPRAERNRGLTDRSSHPTVKPLDLMAHLIKLVTPPGGTILDPFLGSGTTALAASELGVKCIGIEREAEYLDIAKARLMATPMGLGLDAELVGKARKPSLNKPTEWKSDGDGIGKRVAYQDGVGARKAGTIRGGYDGHLMLPKKPKLKADSAPMFDDEEPAA